jgi:formiminoglutamase
MRFLHQAGLLFSRGEPDDPRIGDIVREVQFPEFEREHWDVAILGFPDDRGITLNLGRPGAAAGPNAIRSWFYRLVSPSPSARIADLGDLEMSPDLDHDHDLASEAIGIALEKADKVAILGGGHDWGFSPIQALLRRGGTGFINLDAHLDVRASNVHHSGTSYWRALEAGVPGECAFWYGIQMPGTARMHYEYARGKGGTVAFAGEPSPELSRLDDCDAFDISLDMDVFSMAEAPGVSAPQPTGLPHREVLPLLRSLLKNPRARTFGIYETAPPFDSNEMTARLAARCLWEILKHEPR